jgi:hypothetical protein
VRLVELGAGMTDVVGVVAGMEAAVGVGRSGVEVGVSGMDAGVGHDNDVPTRMIIIAENMRGLILFNVTPYRGPALVV